MGETYRLQKGGKSSQHIVDDLPPRLLTLIPYPHRITVKFFRKIGKFIRCSFSGYPCLYIFCLLHNLLFCGFLSIIFPYITGISICVNIRVIVYTCNCHTNISFRITKLSLPFISIIIPNTIKHFPITI